MGALKLQNFRESAGTLNEVQGSQTSPPLRRAPSAGAAFAAPRLRRATLGPELHMRTARKNSGSSHTSCHCTSALLDT